MRLSVVSVCLKTSVKQAPLGIMFCSSYRYNASKSNKTNVGTFSLATQNEIAAGSIPSFGQKKMVCAVTALVTCCVEGS